MVALARTAAGKNGRGRIQAANAKKEAEKAAKIAENKAEKQRAANSKAMRNRLRCLGQVDLSQTKSPAPPNHASFVCVSGGEPKRVNCP